MKKIIVFLLVICLCIGVVGCGQTEEASSNQSGTIQAQNAQYENSITLLYSAADSFNPYTAKTEINRQLLKLLYEPLVKTDDNFNAHNSIAKSVKISKNVCAVKLKDVKFSDGSKLTAKDVVYSCDLALKSATSYKYKLYELESVEAKDSSTVVFTLKNNDPYFKNVLDFPIIKSGSDKNEDADSVKFPPIGAGRYKLNDDNTALVQNANYFGKKSSIEKINLINSPDQESVSHYIEIGATDIYYSDIADGEIPRMSGTKTNINLNNLVYIGVNHNNEKLALENLRQAISSGIDRKEISKNAYFNNALSATGFFNPVWEPTKSLQNIQITANSQITVENLKEIGYNKLNKDGIRTKDKDTLSFSLLVNKENTARVEAAKLIAAQLEKQGIKITVKSVPYKKYVKLLEKGKFDLYLGEVKITENMDLTPLVSVDGSAAYGIKPVEETEDKDTEQTDDAEAEDDSEEDSEDEVDSEAEEASGDIANDKNKELLTCAKVMINFYNGKNSINDVAVILQNDMPFIPVCYRLGVLFCNENIENMNKTSLSDIYFSIESYKIKKN